MAPMERRPHWVVGERSSPRGPGAEAFAVSPFTRLARAHACAVAGDTLITIALAGSLFFSIDPSSARSKVFLYLALTMAPFAVVAPLVGPALDRTPGGRRMMVVGAAGLRAVVCLLMIDDVDTLFLFPEAFALLVLAKSYHVAKSALVPTVVHSDEELVAANSRLSVISGLVGFVAAVPGGLLLRLGGPEWTLALATVVFAAGVFVGLQIPKASIATGEVSQAERAELRGAAVLLAASAMGLLRGVVGFLTFLVAFGLRTGDAPSWHFGVVLAASALGSLSGAAIAPAARRQIHEERMLVVVLIVVGVAGVVGAWGGDVAGAAVVSATVGMGAASAKQAFDSIVQRDAPDANRGRSFAQFETRFQLTWVAGATVGIIPMPMWLGFLIVAGTAAFGAVSYVAGSRGARRFATRRRSPLDSPRVPDVVRRVVASVTGDPTQLAPVGDHDGDGVGDAWEVELASEPTLVEPRVVRPAEPTVVAGPEQPEADIDAAVPDADDELAFRPTRALRAVDPDDLASRPTRPHQVVDPTLLAEPDDERSPSDRPISTLPPTIVTPGRDAAPPPPPDDDPLPALPPTIVTPHDKREHP